MPSDFLPPDPYADHPGARRPSGPPTFAPPTAPPTSRAQSNRAVMALALGSAGLGVLVFTAGALFVLTLPASVAAWVLGRQAKTLESKREQANVAVIIGIVGTVLGVIAAVAWILIASLTDWTTTTELDGGSGQKPRFDVVRLVTLRP
ncbi:MAG TPA: hypothetical protein VF257_08690 [Solirubrobacteraceae bacterium]